MADASRNNDQDDVYYKEIMTTLSNPGAAKVKKLFIDKLGNEKLWDFIGYIKYPEHKYKELMEMSKNTNEKSLSGYFLESFLSLLETSKSNTTSFLEALDLVDCHDVAIKFCPSFVYQQPKDDVSNETKKTKTQKRKTKDNTAQSGKKSKRPF